MTAILLGVKFCDYLLGNWLAHSDRHCAVFSLASAHSESQCAIGHRYPAAAVLWLRNGWFCSGTQHVLDGAQQARAGSVNFLVGDDQGRGQA